MLCKAGFKMCQAAHVGLVGTESMVGTETFRGPGALELQYLGPKLLKGIAGAYGLQVYQVCALWLL